jgi:hypothetical protein
MDQSSWDDTLVDVGPSRPFPRDAVSMSVLVGQESEAFPGKDLKKGG